MKISPFIAVLWVSFFVSCLSNEQDSSFTPSDSHYSGDIIDLHNHILFQQELGTMSKDRLGSLKELKQITSESSISKQGIITMARRNDLQNTRMKNDWIIDYSMNDSSLIPIGSIHPYDGAEALIEMERIAAKGVRLLKLHPNTQGFDVESDEVKSVVKKASELKLILMLEGTSLLDPAILGKYIILAVQNPTVKFILTHMGGNEFNQYQVFMYLNKYPWYRRNVWFDISATVVEYADSPYKEELVWTMRKVGTDRILFGSDFPVYDPNQSLNSLFKLGLSKEEEQMILHDNYFNLVPSK